MTKLQQDILQVLQNTKTVMSSREIADALKVSTRAVSNSICYLPHDLIIDLDCRPGLPIPSPSGLRRKYDLLTNLLRVELKQAGLDKNRRPRRYAAKGVYPHVETYLDAYEKDSRKAQDTFKQLDRGTQIVLGCPINGSELLSIIGAGTTPAAKRSKALADWQSQ